MEPLEPTSVRIQVHSAALNPADYKFVEVSGARLFSTPPSEANPFRVGFDAAGIVVDVGTQGSGKSQVGDAVYVMTPFTSTGSVAEYVTVDTESVALKPKTLDFLKAASVPAVSLTGYQAIVEHGKLQSGERLLILGGSTSVGMYAIQHAKMIGAYVIATASTSKVDFLKSLGADEVIDYTTTKWSEVVAPHSVDVILECGVEPGCWDAHAQDVLKKDGSRFVTLLPGTPPSEPEFGATHKTVL